MKTTSSISDSLHGVCAALSIALTLAACVHTVPVKLLDRLAPEANESLGMTVAAKGVQLYECRAAKQATGYEWAFVAPEADLFDFRGRLVGTHGAGPFWQSTDGSRIVGKVKTRIDSPVPSAIPWLLLSAESTGSAGIFSKVSSVQRVNTEGGTAPASGCGSDTIGTRVRVAYTADYRFYSAR